MGWHIHSFLFLLLEELLSASQSLVKEGSTGSRISWCSWWPGQQCTGVLFALLCHAPFSSRQLSWLHTLLKMLAQTLLPQTLPLREPRLCRHDRDAPCVKWIPYRWSCSECREAGPWGRLLFPSGFQGDDLNRAPWKASDLFQSCHSAAEETEAQSHMQVRSKARARVHIPYSYSCCLTIESI